VYGYAGYPWLGIPYLGYYGSDLLGYPSDFFDTSDTSDGSANNYVTEDYPGSYAYPPQGPDPNQDDSNQGYQNQGNPNQGDQNLDFENQPNPPNQPYGYQTSPQNYRPNRAVAPPPDQPTVTLVFMDGHRQQIHNYILSRDTLTVLDLRSQQIPVERIDLAATEKLNKDAGVSFHLPSR